MISLGDAIVQGADLRPATKSGWSDDQLSNNKARAKYYEGGACGTKLVNQMKDEVSCGCAVATAAELVGLMVMTKDGYQPGPEVKRVKLDDMRSGRMLEAVELPESWQATLKHVVTSPCGCQYVEGGTYQLMRVIWHLNDAHHWDKAKVGEWVKMIEATLDGKAIAKIIADSPEPITMPVGFSGEARNSHGEPVTLETIVEQTERRNA
jgi:hypothetical protein